MGFRFFHRVPIIGRFVTLNLSKGGASVSVGVPGAHLTHGTHGTRVTVGLPGTGLFYTEQLHLRPSADVRVQRLIEAYRSCAIAREAATAEDYSRAIRLQQELGVRDDELPADMLAARDEILALLQKRFGYQVVKPAPQPRPTGWTRRDGLVIAAVSTLFLLSVLAAMWWS